MNETVAFYESEAGCLFPEEAIRAHLDVAADHGARLHFDERVEDWRIAASGTVEVTTTRSRYEASRLVLAPGPWASELFKMDWLTLVVEPQDFVLVRAIRRCGAVRARRFPIYIWDLGDGVQFYGFPADDDGRVKVAFFRTSEWRRTIAARRACAVHPVTGDRDALVDRRLPIHLHARPSFRAWPSIPTTRKW